ncbi:MAG: U32 family peptidase [Elusimicrobiota bacterium]
MKILSCITDIEEIRYLKKAGADEVNIDAYEEIFESLKVLVNCGIDSMIVSNIGFASFLNKVFPSLNIHLSSINPVFNSEAFSFLRSRIRFSRLILPNQLSAKEAQGLVRTCKSKKVEAKIFFQIFGLSIYNAL